MRLLIRGILFIGLLLVLSACLETANIDGLKETILIEDEGYSKLKYSSEYPVKLLGRYTKSVPTTTKDRGFMAIGDMNPLYKSSGKTTISVDRQYIVMSADIDGKIIPFRLGMTDTSYNSIFSSDSLEMLIPFYLYNKGGASVVYVKLGGNFLLMRPYDPTIPEDSYLSGEWFDSQYEMPHD